MSDPTDVPLLTIRLPEPDFSVGDAHFWVPKPYGPPQTPRGLHRQRRRRRRNLRHYTRHGRMWDPWHGWTHVTPLEDLDPPTTTCAPCLSYLAEYGDTALTVELAQDLLARHDGEACAGTSGLASFVEEGE